MKLKRAKTQCKKFYKTCQGLSKELTHVFVVIILLFLIENGMLAYNHVQTHTPILGLKFHNKNLTGLSKSQMEKVVKQEVTHNTRPLQFSYQNRIIVVRPPEIGARVDIEATVDHLLKIGRTGGFLKKLFDQHQALFGLKNEKITGNISQSLLTIKLLEFQDAINKDALPSMPDFVHNINTTLPAQEGIKVDTNKLTILIVDNIFNPPSSPIPAPIIKVFPPSDQERNVVLIRKEALLLTKEPLSIVSGDEVFTLTTGDLLSLLTLVERPDPQNPKKLSLSLRLDHRKLNQKLGAFAQKVESHTLSEFNDHDARVAIYSQFYSKKRKRIPISTGRAFLNRKVLGVQTSPGPKIVYLTFDDGPNAIYHPLILDILKTYDIKATFFLVGENAMKNPQITTSTVSEGHSVGNHSLTHPFLPNLRETSIVKEIKTTDEILKSFNNNQDVTLFRPPYGGVNFFVKKYAEDLGLKLILWDVDPRDWSEPDTNELVRRVVSNTTNGSDVLLHSNHLATVKALPKIIEELKSKGFIFQMLH